MKGEAVSEIQDLLLVLLVCDEVLHQRVVRESSPAMVVSLTHSTSSSFDASLGFQGYHKESCTDHTCTLASYCGLPSLQLGRHECWIVEVEKKDDVE